MKKLFAILMAAMMLLCCVACGGNDTPTPTPGTDTPVSLTVGTGGTAGTYYAYTNAVGMILGEATGYSYNVISTGGSLKALDALAEKTQCTIVGQAAVLAEGDAAERKDIIFLEPLPLFFH